MSEVRGTSWEDPHARGVVAERSYSMSMVRGSSREELPHVRGQGQQPKGVIPRPRSGWQLRGATPCSRSGAGAKSARLLQHRNSQEDVPLPESRGGAQEEQPHVQGAVAAWASEGLEELFHVQGREGRW